MSNLGWSGVCCVSSPRGQIWHTQLCNLALLSWLCLYVCHIASGLQLAGWLQMAGLRGQQ